ncbi:GNAT family N-acetyltransferase [Candidatus Beckwithbacteria bacterium]|nr:GNAT family N-acetyltransferase [Candidatus Beckwithbacteria bacterium]
MKIIKASNKDELANEWQIFTWLNYGEGAQWVKKHFRFKAIENQKIIGTIDGKYEAGIVFIASLMVVENNRKKGVGKKLIEKAEAYGKKLHAHKTFLFTGKHWPSCAFYAKLGFKPIIELPDFYLHKDFVIYMRLIT